MDTNLSRSGTSSPEGKMIDRITVPMAEKMRKDAEFAARCARQTLAEYIRESLGLRLYGELEVIENRVTFRGRDQCDKSLTNI